MTTSSATGRALSRSSGWALAAEGVRLAGALLVTVVLAVTYGPEDYGVLMGTLALLWLVLPVAGGGAGLLLVRRVAQGADPGASFATAVGTVTLASLATVPLLVVLRPLVLPQSPVAVVLLFGLGELWMFGVLELVHWLGQGLERLQLGLQVRVLLALTRGAAAAGFALVADAPELWAWPAVHLLSTMVASAGALVLVHRVVGPLRAPRRPPRGELVEGLGYALGFAADEVRVNLDTVLLVRLGAGAEAGWYAAAYRVVSFATAPLRSLVHASNARFFVVGGRPGAAAALAVRLSAAGVAAGLVLGGAAALAAPFVADLLGDGYEGMVPVLRALAVLPALAAVEAFAAGAVTATGRHRLRLVGMVGAAVLNLVLNLALIPPYGWAGAFIATVISGAAYSLWVWMVLLRGQQVPA